MGYQLQFPSGHVLEFDQMPSQEQIQQIGQKLGVQAQQSQQGGLLGNTLGVAAKAATNAVSSVGAGAAMVGGALASPFSDEASDSMYELARRENEGEPNSIRGYMNKNLTEAGMQPTGLGEKAANLAGNIAPLALGPIGAVTAMGANSAQQMTNYQDQGVGPDTSRQLAQGQFLGGAVAGAIVPGGTTLPQAAMSMVGQGVASRAATNAYLKHEGYDAVAQKQPGAFDFGSMAEDAVFGAAAHHFFGPNATAEDEVKPPPEQLNLDLQGGRGGEAPGEHTMPEEPGPGYNPGRWGYSNDEIDGWKPPPESWKQEGGPQRGQQEELFSRDEAPHPGDEHIAPNEMEGSPGKGGYDGPLEQQRAEDARAQNDMDAEGGSQVPVTPRKTMPNGRELTPEELADDARWGAEGGRIPSRDMPRAGVLDGRMFYDSRPSEDISHLLQDAGRNSEGVKVSKFDPGEFLDWVSKNSKSPFLRGGANILGKFGNVLKDLDIFVQHGLYDGAADADNSRGYYSAPRHAIILGDKYLNSATLMHEMFHAATSRALKMALAYPERFPAAVKLREELENLLNKITALGDWKMGEPGKDGSYKFAKQMPEVGRAPIYGLTNVHEMISEAWSNTGFRELLSKMGFMEKVKDAVYKFFGNENKTALDQVTGLSEKIGEFADKNWDEISRSMAEYAKTASIADLKLPGQTVAEAVAKKFTGNPKVNAITKGIPGMKGMSVENIAKTLDPESIVDMFKKEKDLPDSFWTKVVKNFTISGEQMANLFRSPGLYAFTRYFDRAHTLSDFYEKTVVTPLKENLKQLIPDANWKSLEKVKSVMMAEDLANEGRRPDLVAKLNPAEQKAYKLLRDAFDKQVDHVNEQRLAMGLDPITPRGAYMASHWDGPWRAEVHTKIKGSDGQYKMNDDGTHALSYVGPITGHSIAEVRKGLEYVQKTNKDAVITQQPKYKQQVGDYRKNVVQTYKDMVKLLGENSPGMQDMRRALEGEAEKMGMNVEDFAKHFETKHGARFFGGDRPWMDPRKDTMSWYRNQLDTLHDGYKWSAMQKAITDAKGVLSDPHMIKNMPEMHNVLTEYSRIQMGFGKADSVSKFENAFYKTMGEFFDTVPGLREVPIDMRTGMMLMRNAKNLIYLKALGFWKPAHFFVNGIFQPFFTMPRHMKLSAEGYSHNPWTTLTRSMRDAQAILLNHYAEQMGGTGPKMDDFAQKMSDFIKSNGIATNNPFSDVGELGRTKLDAFIKRSQAIGGYFMQEGERLARVNAFVSFAHHLDQSGKFTDMNELFQEAKRNTTETMGSFKHTDRAAAFVKAGITGTGLSTLRQFEINFMNQFHDLIKYGMETKNYGPLALFSGIQLAFAGVMGFIGFETIDQIWRWFRDMIPTSMVSKEFAQWSPKAAAMKDLPQLLSRGLVSPMTGINFASSLEAGTIVDPSLSGMLPFISEIKNTIVPAWDYVTNPTSDNLHKMVWNETPYGSRGTLETGKFAGMDLPDSLNTKSWYNSPSGVSQSPNNPGEGSYRRTPEDTNIRSWGFLSTQEGQSKEAEFMSKEDDKMFMNRQQDVMKALDSSIRNHDVAMGGNSIQKYIEMQGDPQKAFSNEHFMKMAMDWNTSYEDRTAMGTSSGLEGIYKYQRLHEMLNQIKRYYGPANAAR